MPRASRYLFERELEILRAWTRACRGCLGPAMRRAAPPRIEPRRQFPQDLRRLRESAYVPDPIATRRPRDLPAPRFRRPWPRGRAAIAALASALIHLAALGLLLLRPASSGRPAPHERIVTIRWSRPVSPEEASRRRSRPAVIQPRLPNPAPSSPVPRPREPDRPPVDRSPPSTPRDERPAPAPRTAQRPSDALRTSPSRLAIRRPLPALGLGPAASGTRSGASGRSGTGLIASRGTGKLEALGRYGGNGETEDAVARGLRWLAAHQDSDGGWSAADYVRHCRHHEPCPGRGHADFDVAVTALATLAFLGAGHRPGGETAWSHHVDRAIEWLTSHQSGAGVIGARGDKYLYNHAIALLALAEAHGMSPRAPLRESLEAAVAFSARAQQPGGGWDYSADRTGRNDLSITGWQILALHAARSAGVAVGPSVEQGARAHLSHAFTSRGEGIYANLDPEAGRRGPNMAAVAALGHLTLGGSTEDPRVRRATQTIVRAHPPEIRGLADWDRSFQSYYYWYCASLALFHVGGAPWRAWNEHLQRVLLPLQSDIDHRDGSWDPEPSWIGQSGGRVYSTAINVLTLEVYYRYPPLHAARRS